MITLSKERNRISQISGLILLCDWLFLATGVKFVFCFLRFWLLLLDGFAGALAFVLCPVSMAFCLLIKSRCFKKIIISQISTILIVYIRVYIYANMNKCIHSPVYVTHILCDLLIIMYIVF